MSCNGPKKEGRNWRVRRDAASDPNATPEVLRMSLLKDKSWEVRYAAASNPNATLEVLEMASKDQDARVRHAAASNPNATPDIRETALRTLREDDELVRRITAERFQSSE